jgi:hypothetical protein
VNTFSTRQTTDAETVCVNYATQLVSFRQPRTCCTCTRALSKRASSTACLSIMSGFAMKCEIYIVTRRRLNPDQKPETVVAAFNASVGWCIRFNERWGISSQSRTNKHVEHVESRLHKVSEFHRWLIYEMQARVPQRCVKYGRFPPSHMFHVDQIPLPFCSPTQRTMNPINSQCEVKQPGGSGASKRFATLQLCICAQADRQVVKLELYFRGKAPVLALTLKTPSCNPHMGIKFVVGGT